MFRLANRVAALEKNFPHACGDVPVLRVNVVGAEGFFPRLWGCSALKQAMQTLLDIFPTPVGMFQTMEMCEAYGSNV